ncbi:baseplate J/gp47 family protein [uncultured Microscilla sp.]|uniref:baseplate J/gp47 family protein n=1 Tax=uncultured Microscilla sp. TaxID=432653 RepID=UPI00260FE6E8|nr:baseplate J/gp47 family protein [uncultured Microscilla sp.]
MSDNQELYYRDGTSQLQRTQAALDKGYVRIEERTIEDWLKFAEKYAEELNYYAADNQIQGNWRGFLSGNVSKDEIMAYLKDPESLADQPSKQEWMSRPHFVLLLAFLQLLDQHLKPALNHLLPRHLDYYYHEVLKFVQKPAQPDRVYLMFELAKNYANDRFLLAENTALLAGKDGTGKDLIYKTRQKLMVNRAKVAQIKSIFVNREVKQPSSYPLPGGFFQMLKLALGQVTDTSVTPHQVWLKPGADLPVPGVLGFASAPTEQTANAFFAKVKSALAFTQDELNMSFADLRLLMHLKQNRDNDSHQWAQINQELAQMKNGGTYTSKDFVANFTAAAGHSPLDDTVYQVVQSVNNVYDLYQELNLATTGQYDLFKPLEEPLENHGYADINRVRNLRTFINDNFYNSSSDDQVANQYVNGFHRMMQVRIAVYDEWLEIQERLNNVAGLNNEADFENIELPNFNQLFESRYGSMPNFAGLDASITTLDQYFDTLTTLEQYFALFMEEIQQLMDNALVKQDQNTVTDLLYKAHQQKRTVIRQNELAALDKTSVALFNAAFGQPDPGDDYPMLPAGSSTLEDLVPLLEATPPDETAQRYVTNVLKLTIEDFKFIIALCAQHNESFTAPTWQWNKAYRLLAEAEAKIRGGNMAVTPTITHLNGLYAFDEATMATTGDEDETFDRWRTFGRVEADKLTQLGIAIHSPVLALSGGERTIELNLELNPNLTPAQEQAIQAIDLEDNPFGAELTTEQGWQAVTDFASIDFTIATVTDPDTGNPVDIKTLKIACTLTSDFDPVQALSPDAEGYLASEPTLRLLVGQPGLELGELTAHDLFSQVLVKKIDLKVTVQNLVPSQIRNDVATLQAKEAFAPLGSTPVPKSNFYFTHPELMFKQLDSVALQLNWLGLPSDWSAHYNHYSNQDAANIKATLDLYDQGVKRRFSINDATEDFELLNSTGVDLSLDASIENTAPFKYTPLAPTPIANDLFANPRYFVLQLGNVDFGHSEYPILATSKSTQLAIDLQNSASTAVVNYQVNAPYTPELQNFSIHYTASVSIGEEKASASANPATMLHLHPFGYAAVGQEQIEEVTFLPAYAQEGYLYLGIKDLDPPYDLSLLFRMAEGSANPDLTPANIDWRYLVDDEWKILTQKGRIITDGTNGLLNSGIIKLRMPAETNATHRLMPTGYYWLRASVRNNSEGLSDAIGIHAQAVEAVFDNNQNDPQHLKNPLPAHSIQRTYLPQNELKGVSQPYSSFGGQTIESLERLNTRISERLRHKNRAVNIWDYERLVLEAFSEVYKAKCLPGELLNDGHPGEVRLIVVPNIGGIRPYDPFKPKLSGDVLQSIENYLTQRMPAPASVTVRNPVYHELKIFMQVVFQEAYQADNKYYLEVLQQALQEYLAPWAFDTGADIALGGKLYPNLIVDFVERLEYIDYINNFSMTYNDGENIWPITPEQMQTGLIAQQADVVWVSAREHRLSAIGNVGDDGTGIGYMMVANDFTVA